MAMETEIREVLPDGNVFDDNGDIVPGDGDEVSPTSPEDLPDWEILRDVEFSLISPEDLREIRSYIAQNTIFEKLWDDADRKSLEPPQIPPILRELNQRMNELAQKYDLTRDELLEAAK